MKEKQKVFWKNKNVLLKLSDNGDRWIFYLIEKKLYKGNEYRLFHVNESIISYLHNTYDDYYKKSNNLNVILIKLFNSIIELMEGD